MTMCYPTPRQCAATALLMCLGAAGAWAHGGGGDKACSSAAKLLLKACSADSLDNALTAAATCRNISDATAQSACLADSKDQRKSGRGDCGDVYQSRLDVCDAVGEAPYEPPFGADAAGDFVDPRDIGGAVAPNPYFPLLPGAQWKYLTTYQNENGDTITENDTVTVTGDTKLIDGVTCVIVTDVVSASDGTVEDTQDWFAQDATGNVWYCGEIAQQKETFDGDAPPTPELVDIEGSWKSGREGAKAGIQMLAAPAVGQSYRQELKWADAEDAATVLSVDADESVSGGAFICNGQCIETHDFSGLEPDASENKFYKRDVGLILEVDQTNGARNELVSYTVPD